MSSFSENFKTIEVISKVLDHTNYFFEITLKCYLIS